MNTAYTINVLDKDVHLYMAKERKLKTGNMTEWSGQGSDDVIAQCDDSTRLWVVTCVCWTQELGKFYGDFRKKLSTLYVLLGGSLEVGTHF